MFWCRSFTLRWWTPLQYCDTGALPSNGWSSYDVGVFSSDGGCCFEFVVFEVWSFCGHWSTVTIVVLWPLRCCGHWSTVTTRCWGSSVHCCDHWGNMAIKILGPFRCLGYWGVATTEVLWRLNVSISQVVDTPGILDHPVEEMNTIEMQAIAALSHLRAIIIYMMDLSEQCEHTVEEQVRRETAQGSKPSWRLKTHKRFRGTLLVRNKYVQKQHRVQNPAEGSKHINGSEEHCWKGQNATCTFSG